MSVGPSARTIVFFIRRLDNVEIMVLKLRLSMRSMRIFQLSNKHSFCISEILSAYKNEANNIKRILVVKIKNQNMIIPWLEALSKKNILKINSSISLGRLTLNTNQI